MIKKKHLHPSENIMEAMTEKAAYRILRSYEGREKPKKYRNTYTLFDEHNHQDSVTCDLIGQAVFATLQFKCADGSRFELLPNRRVMPSRWLMTDHEGSISFQFDQKIAGKFLNPVQRTLIVVFDDQEREIVRIVDLHRAKPAALVGLEFGKFALTQNDQIVAEFGSLPRKKLKKRKGLLGRIKEFIQATDPALVSLTGTLPLPPAAALALYLLFEELSDTSVE